MMLYNKLCSKCFLYCCFFFFQAEDGIRDWSVTGVQTCALPICFGEVLRQRHVRLGVVAIFVYVGAEVTIGSFMINYIATPRIGNIDPASATHYVSYYWGSAMIGRFIRSEERRVGKEGRSGWRGG